MTSGNNKRGQLRSAMHTGSRMPIFIILGLLVVSSVLAINYWTTTGQRSQLEEDLALLQKKYNLLLLETKEVRSNYEQLQNDAKEKETKAFERIKALETSRDDEKKQAAALNEKVVQLKGNLEMCFRNMTTCTNDADTQMQAVKTRDEENHSLKDQINNLQKQVAEFESKISSLEQTPKSQKSASQKEKSDENERTSKSLIPDEFEKLAENETSSVFQSNLNTSSIDEAENQTMIEDKKVSPKTIKRNSDELNQLPAPINVPSKEEKEEAKVATSEDLKGVVPKKAQGVMPDKFKAVTSAKFTTVTPKNVGDRGEEDDQVVKPPVLGRAALKKPKYGKPVQRDEGIRRNNNDEQEDQDQKPRGGAADEDEDYAPPAAANRQ